MWISYTQGKEASMLEGGALAERSVKIINRTTLHPLFSRMIESQVPGTSRPEVLLWMGPGKRSLGDSSEEGLPHILHIPLLPSLEGHGKM